MMSNYYRNLLEGYTCIKMKSLSIEQAYKLTQPFTYSRKILKIQSTNHKSNWTSGGGTYQGAIPPKISNKDGLSKEIEIHEQEQQELELEKVFRYFWGERKKMVGRRHLGGDKVGHTPARCHLGDRRAHQGYDGLGWTPGSLQVSLCPFFRGKNYFKFSRIFGKLYFWPIFRV